MLIPRFHARLLLAHAGLARAGLAIVVLALSACASDPPPVPPAPLAALTPTLESSVLWRAQAGDGGAGRFLPLARDGRVVVANAKGLVTAFDSSTGKRLWRTDLDTRLGSGVGGDDKRVYASSANGRVHALDALTGEKLWFRDASSEVLVPVAAGFDTVVVRSADGRLMVLNAEDGSERWSVSNPPPALTLHGNSRPLLVDGGVLVGLDDGRLIALNLANGRTIWETVLSLPSGRSEVERLVDIDADIVIDDAAIYAANYRGKVARLEPARGRIVWSMPVSSVAGLALAGERVLVIDERDGVHAYDRESGRELWSQPALEGRRLSPPVVVDGTLVTADYEGYLHLLSVDDGTIVGRRRVAKYPVLGAAQLLDGALVVQASDGSLTALRIGE